MTIPIVLLAAGLLVGVLIGVVIPRARRPAPRADRPTATRRILLPFTGTTVSRRALEAALRLAGIEHATLMPAFLARVPLNLPLDSPLPRQCDIGMPLLEAIEQRAAAQGTPVDARVERGRSFRHALSRLLETERFDRVIISATDDPTVGLSGDDIIWVLQHATAEVLILRPAPDDPRTITGNGVRGHF
jgi:nucleotide-binding universal stress UspA family protein